MVKQQSRWRSEDLSATSPLKLLFNVGVTYARRAGVVTYCLAIFLYRSIHSLKTKSLKVRGPISDFSP